MELADWLRERSEIFASFAASRGLTVVLDVEEVLPVSIDVRKIEEGALLLCEHLLRGYWRERKLHVSLRQEEAGAAAVIRIWATGAQGGTRDAPSQDEFHGSPGEPRMAMALAEELIELHGGRLTTELMADGTETFAIRLPVRPGDPGGRATSWTGSSTENPASPQQAPINSARVTPASAAYLARVNAEIDAHLHDSSYRVGTLALALSISESQLKRRLRALAGCSPVELIRQRCLEQAAALLAEAESVSEVCYTVGFNSPSYFSRCFREHFGVTPSEYVHQHFPPSTYDL